MRKDKVCATICRAVQVGVNEWDDVRNSKIFNIESSIKDVLDWATSTLREPVTINSIKFSTIDDE